MFFIINIQYTCIVLYNIFLLLIFKIRTEVFGKYVFQGLVSRDPFTIYSIESQTKFTVFNHCNEYNFLSWGYLLCVHVFKHLIYMYNVTVYISAGTFITITNLCARLGSDPVLVSWYCLSPPLKNIFINPSNILK